MSELPFDIKYNKSISILSLEEGVSWNSAHDTLLSEFHRLSGDEEKFDKLLKEWEL